MPYESISEFLAALQDHGELARISVPVDSALELAAITDRITKVSSDGGPALLFDSVKNSTIPVVTNLLGSRNRLSLALGIASLDDLPPALEQRLPADSAGGWLDSLGVAQRWVGLKKWSPKSVKTAACQQVVRMGKDVNLWDLPVPRSWPGETYPVITAGQIVAANLQTGQIHVFRSLLAVVSPQELGWYQSSVAESAVLRAAIDSQQNLPVAISLGADPILPLASSIPTPDPRSLAGLLRGTSLDVVRCRTCELEVPAASEFVFEGYVDFEHSRCAAPASIARDNGRYVERELVSIHVTAITHRANPVFPAIIASAPPGEESWISVAAERLMLPVLQTSIPEIVDIHRPVCAAGRNLLFVSIRKTVDFQARRVLHALWGTEFLGQTKMIVIVDADQDVRSEQQIWFTVGTNCCPERDFLFCDGLARDDDYTLLSPGLASRVGIDATRKTANESSASWPMPLAVSEEMALRVKERWEEYGMGEGRR